MKNISFILLVAVLLTGSDALPNESQFKSVNGVQISTISLIESEDPANNEETAESGYHISSHASTDSENEPEPVLINVITGKVGDNMPLFAFRSYGLLSKHPDTFNSFIIQLQIINAETNKLISSFNFSDLKIGLDVFPGIPGDYYKIEFIDVDFDGDRDIQIYAAPNGTLYAHYIYFIWDSDKNCFIKDPYNLADLRMPEFDLEKHLVYETVIARHDYSWHYAYQYIGDDLIVVESISNTMVEDHAWNASLISKIQAIEPLYAYRHTYFQHHMVKRRDMQTMELILLENKYRLYTHDHFDDYTPLAEYEYCSDIGLILRNHDIETDEK